MCAYHYRQSPQAVFRDVDSTTRPTRKRPKKLKKVFWQPQRKRPAIAVVAPPERIEIPDRAEAYPTSLAGL